MRSQNSLLKEAKGNVKHYITDQHISNYINFSGLIIKSYTKLDPNNPYNKPMTNILSMVFLVTAAYHLYNTLSTYQKHKQISDDSVNQSSKLTTYSILSFAFAYIAQNNLSDKNSNSTIIEMAGLFAFITYNSISDYMQADKLIESELDLLTQDKNTKTEDTSWQDTILATNKSSSGSELNRSQS